MNASWTKGAEQVDDTESLEIPMLEMTECELLVSKDRLKLMPGFLS